MSFSLPRRFPDLSDEQLETKCGTLDSQSQEAKFMQKEMARRQKDKLRGERAFGATREALPFAMAFFGLCYSFILRDTPYDLFRGPLPGEQRILLSLTILALLTYPIQRWISYVKEQKKLRHRPSAEPK